MTAIPAAAPARTLPTRPFVAAAGTFLAGLATIAGAWAFQIYGGFIPCKLCLEERIPYYVGVPLALAALAAAFLGAGRAARILLLAVALTFLVGLGLGVYHAGVEWDLWLGPSDCGGGAALGSSIEDLTRQMQGIRVVSCSEASWRFLYLSFAGWNAVASAVLVAGALWGALARRPAA